MRATFATYPSSDTSLSFASLYKRNDVRKRFTSRYDPERNLDAFKVMQERIVKGELPFKVHINGINGNGWGNRLYSIMSSYAIALLTDSALFVSMKDHVSYIKEPFYKAFFDWPTDSDYNVWHDQAHMQYISFGYGWHVYRKALDLAKSEIRIDPAIKRTYYWGLEAEFFTLLCNIKYHEKLYSLGLVSRESVDDAREKMSDTTNAKYTNDEQLNAALQVGYEFAGNVLNLHWEPYDKYMDYANEYWEKYFKNNYVIGWQLRTGFFDFLTGVYVWEQCAFELEKLQAQELPVKWFIIIDNLDWLDLLRAKYPDKIIFYRDRSLDHGLTILVDIELMSRCDEIILTGSSTFGMIAGFKSMKMPYYVNAKEGGIGSEQCKRMDLAHPPVRDTWIASFKK